MDPKNTTLRASVDVSKPDLHDFVFCFGFG